MFEKVNPSHPDKIADRIAGAIVDIAYEKAANPRIAVECLIGHGRCYVMAETSEHFFPREVDAVVKRIAGEGIMTTYLEAKQDSNLSENQRYGIRCGDNGIFRGVPTTTEQQRLSDIANDIYGMYWTDGNYILDGDKLIICQSNANEELQEAYPHAVINPIGYWTGGVNVDTGAVNRKLGSDMGDAVTGGGLHGKDLSKADVSVNIYAYIKAQKEKKPVELCCAIGDEEVDGIPYADIVEIARAFISRAGGFEKFAEWGLI